MADVEQVIIIGSGPAGYTAALYTARADLSPLVIEGFLWGGLLQQTTEVENYPGFREGIMGPALMQTMRDQAERFGARFLTDNVDPRRAGRRGGRPAHRLGRRRGVPGPHGDPRDGRRAPQARRARRGGAGQRPRRLLLRDLRRRVLQGQRDDHRRRRRLRDGGGDLPRQVRLEGHDRAPARRVPRLADHVRPRQGDREHRAADALRRRGVPAPARTALLGSARLRNAETGEERELPMAGAFVAVGHVPQSEIVEGIVETDENGYVVVDGRSTRTNVPGRVRRRRPRRPHLPPGGHRGRHRAARRRSTPSGTCATTRTCRRPPRSRAPATSPRSSGSTTSPSRARSARRAQRTRSV